jgi:uroporphyrin-III C-methyltransferase
VSVAEKGKVYLVGAGPGDPDLLTLKAARLLAEADVILHDDLVSPSILALSGERALLMSVGKRCGRKKITQAAIHDLMISSARRKLAVVRLKAGDPLIFGRAGEEMDALRAAQIPFEVVPGVTAASSAAALLETSLTDRRVASKLIVFSGHHAAGEMAKQGLCPAIFAEDATVAIYMPGDNLSEMASTLLRNGVSGSLPCVAVSDASRPEARYQACRLSGLAHLILPPGPRLLLVGRAFESVLGGGAPVETASLDGVLELARSIHLE